jgi:hypothetical protein
MVTDADLDERSDIVKARTDALGHDALRDGVPATGGAVTISGTAVALGEGIVYADGVRGVVAAAPGASLSGPLVIFGQQADLPLGPALPAAAAIVYADIWERPVFALEDSYLADPGLHGAETAYRSRTMTQLKAAPLADAAAIEAGSGRYPSIGDAVLAVAPRDPETSIDECDPCADVVTAEQRIANALFRLEVVAVEGPPDAPARVHLAWSAENGAAIAPAAVSPEEFERAGRVYEFFSGITESYMGAFADPGDVRASAFVDDLEATPSPAQDHDGNDWPFVRRWDGHAIIDVGAGAVAATLGSGFTVGFDGTTVTLNVDAFDAELTLAGHRVLRGDYWLVELRTFAAAAARVRLVQATPVGIRHHYCLLVRTESGAIQPLTDAEERRLSFPPLSALPASHVGFVNNCPKLYADAENVQEALDELCAISADDIGFDPSNCPALYDEAKTVQAALDRLCRLNFSIETVLRLLMDWGVVCGLTVRLVKQFGSEVVIAPGWFLDRAGRLVMFKGGQIDFNKLKRHPPDMRDEVFIKLLRDGGICLAVAEDPDAPGQASAYLVAHELAFGPADPSLLEVFRQCLEGQKRLKIGDRTGALDPRMRAIVDKVAIVAAHDDTLSGAQRLEAGEAEAAKAFSLGLLEEYRAFADPEDIARVERDWAEIEERFGGGAVGETREVRLMQLEAARLGALLLNDQQRAERCLCAAIFPPCPPELGKPPFFVPIARPIAVFDGGILLLQVCMHACRKQALTWRKIQYVMKDWRATLAERLAAICCRDEDDKPDGPKSFGTRLVYDPKLEERSLFELTERYQLIEGALAPPGRSIFRVQPDVHDLSVAAATDVMTGNGADVAGVVDIDDPKAIEAIKGTSGTFSAIDQLGDPGVLQPGDKVALLVQDGVARGYVVVERGAGKYIFETRSEQQKRPTLDRDQAKRLGDLASRLGKVTDTEVKLTSEIDTLARTGEQLSGDFDRLKEEVAALSAERTQTEKAVAAARAELGELVKAQQAATAAIAAARKELEATDARRTEFVLTMRRNQPMASLGAVQPASANRLAQAGILSVGDAADLKDEDLTRLVEQRVLSRAEAKALTEAVQAFLARDVR